MRGTFYCNIYGTKEELDNAYKKLEELAKSIDDVAFALDYSRKYDDKITIGTLDGDMPLEGTPFDDGDWFGEKIASELVDYKITIKKEYNETINFNEELVKEAGSDSFEDVTPETGIGCISDFEHYFPETDEFEIADDITCDFYDFGKVPADIFRNEEGIIKLPKGEEAFEAEGTCGNMGKVIVYMYAFDNLFETNMDLYDEEKDVFELLNSDGNKENGKTVPAALFKDDAGEFESKQVSYKPDGSDAYIFVYLKK